MNFQSADLGLFVCDNPLRFQLLELHGLGIGHI